MKIKDTRKDNIVPFKTLKKGEVFAKDVAVETMDGDTIIKSELFMVIEDVATVDVINDYGGVETYFNAIKLSDGTVEVFMDETEVRKVNAELNIF